jgi:beta-carotene 3-hydroxylase
MAAGLSGAALTSNFAAKNPALLAGARRSRGAPPLAGRALPFSPLTTASRSPRRRGLGTVVTHFMPQDTEVGHAAMVPAAPVPVPEMTGTALEKEARAAAAQRVAERKARKRSERRTYLVATVMSSFGVMSMHVAAVYYRFSWQMKEVPVTEMLGTFALSMGAAVGMEFWARWAHRTLWHASLWHMCWSISELSTFPYQLKLLG